jgi:hypothetical protein
MGREAREHAETLTWDSTADELVCEYRCVVAKRFATAQSLNGVVTKLYPPVPGSPAAFLEE